jgi:sortase A
VLAAARRLIGTTDMRRFGWPQALQVRALAIVLLAAGLWQFGGGVYIHAKACLAQHLLKSAWDQTRVSGEAVKPWPWADTAPLARLTVPARGVDLLVLEGSSGRSLAFGPGHITGTARPGERGNCVISAHRDTHFTFLKHLRLGEEIRIENAQGDQQRYRVVEMRITDENDARVLLDTSDSLLTLVTCFPFDAVAAGGPLRYIVIAERIGPLA